jgi:hypothetical protein
MLGKKHILDEKLHAKYGEVVRIKPNQLSFTGEEAWRDIYMHRQGQPQMAKWGRGSSNDKGVYSIINAPDDIHARQRKSLSHAFSERAVCIAYIVATLLRLMLLSVKRAGVPDYDIHRHPHFKHTPGCTQRMAFEYGIVL